MNSENTRAAMAESLRTRVFAAYALCSVAESHIRDGRLDNAVETVRVIRRMVTEATRLAGEPHAHSNIRETAELLPDLERKIAKLEASIG